jgi:hypothetical protein
MMDGGMATADATTGPALAAETPAPAALEGRLDAIAGGKVYGWARDRSRPDASLAVELRLDGQPVGEGSADRPRADLEAGGLGAHAFEIETALPDDTPLERLSALVTVPGTGESLVLQAPSSGERAVDAAIAPHMAQLAQRLDQLRRDQRRLAQAQLQAVGELRGSLAQPTEAPAELIRLAEGQKVLGERLEALELCLVRIDQSLGGLAAKAVAPQAGNSVLTPPIALGAIGAIAFLGLAVLVHALA